MQDLIEKADVLIKALPYIQKFRDAVVVVKFGGSAMEQKDKYDGILTDVTFMECVGMLPVIVHGGGKAISREMEKKGIRPKFVRGLRVTDEATIEVVHKVLTEEINPDIVSAIESAGGRARGLAGETMFSVEKHVETDPATGATQDWGYVGSPTGVNADPIRQCFRDQCIPVITPLGTGPEGKLYNINADDAAAMVGRELKARKVVFLSDVPGLLRDPNDPGSIISTLSEKQVEQLISAGVIAGGMLPKIQGALDALKAGVQKVHIVDGRLDHSLLLEIFTDKGVGTEIIA